MEPVSAERKKYLAERAKENRRVRLRLQEPGNEVALEAYRAKARERARLSRERRIAAPAVVKPLFPDDTPKPSHVGFFFQFPKRR